MNDSSNVHKSPGIVDADQFWTGLIQIPLLKSSMVEALLRYEIGKVYPGSIDTVSDIRWERLDGLFPDPGAKQSNYLILIPFREGERGFAPMQILVRLLTRVSTKPSVLVAQSGEHCELLFRDAEGTMVHQFTEKSDLVKYVNLSEAQSIAVLRSDPGFSLPFTMARVVYFEEKSLDWSSLLKLPLRNDGSHLERYWRRVLMGGAVVCILLIIALGWRAYTDKDHQLAELKGRVIRMQQELQVDSVSSSAQNNLKTDVAELEKLQPVEVYHYIQRVADLLISSDRILSVRWDGQTRLMAIELSSHRAVRLVEELDQSGIFAKLSSSGMSNSADDKTSLRFTITGSVP